MVLFKVPARLRGTTVAGMPPVLDKWSGRDRKPVMTPSHPVITQQVQVIEMIDWTSFKAAASALWHHIQPFMYWFDAPCHSQATTWVWISARGPHRVRPDFRVPHCPHLLPTARFCECCQGSGGFSWRACHLVKCYAEWVLSERTRCCSVLMRS